MLLCYQSASWGIVLGMDLLLTILGAILVIVGVVWLLGGSLIWGIVLIVVGLLLLGYRYGYSGRGTAL